MQRGLNTDMDRIYWRKYFTRPHATHQHGPDAAGHDADDSPHDGESPTGRCEQTSRFRPGQQKIATEAFGLAW